MQNEKKHFYLKLLIKISFRKHFMIFFFEKM